MKDDSDSRIKLVRYLDKNKLTKGDIADIVMAHKTLTDELERARKDVLYFQRCNKNSWMKSRIRCLELTILAMKDSPRWNSKKRRKK